LNHFTLPVGTESPHRRRIWLRQHERHRTRGASSRL